MDTDSLFQERENSLSRGTGQRVISSQRKELKTDHQSSSPTPRKPRMGQSSLIQVQPVMPVSSSRTPQRSDGHIYSNDHIQSGVDSDDVKIRDAPTKRHAVRESVVSIRDSPLYEDQTYAHETERESGASDEPPTPPPRKYLTDDVRPLAYDL